LNATSFLNTGLLLTKPSNAFYGLSHMNTPSKRKAATLDQERIDDLVVSQASDESAWNAPVRVKRSERAALSLPGEPAAREVFPDRSPAALRRSQTSPQKAAPGRAQGVHRRPK
jgi:hypothetical protein